jgi:prevent-host-death family protein
VDTISLFDAKNRLSALVDQVEEGHELTITRRGKPVARLVPVSAPAGQGAEAAVRLLRLRQGIAGRSEVFTWDELKTYRDIGRR